jgi:superfamily II RNA helicase
MPPSGLTGMKVRRVARLAWNFRRISVVYGCFCVAFLRCTEAFTDGLSVVTTMGRYHPNRLIQKHNLRMPTTLASSVSPTESNEEEQRRIAMAVNVARQELSNYFDFPLDDWQLQAGGEILLGNNVIVSAPTGSGKTVVGEMALHFAFLKEMEGIYTTPLKALSNQKFSELRQIFGAPNVGLSTGDMSVNRQNARITVMTTEVYRNIAWRYNSGGDGTKPQTRVVVPDEKEFLYRDNSLEKNAVVVLDEFHYMGMPGRGGVWEECVITSPAHTQIVGLSATLPNALQLAEWMEFVTGRKTVLVEAPGSRPVPLRYLFATREGLFPLFRNPDAGPGSPLGLLGYRGEGTPVGKAPQRKTTAGFGAKSDEEDDNEDWGAIGKADKLPRGLEINPALKASAQRRLQRVNRMLERQKERQWDRLESQEGDWDLYGGDGDGRRRGRAAAPSNRRMSAREEERERDRLLKREMRKAVPSLPILLSRLNEKRLLPAIWFIFSRAGCDQAAQAIVNNFKGPRDVTKDIDLNDFEDQPAKKPKTRQRGMRNEEGDILVEDDKGRTFRLSSNYVSEDVFNSALDGSSSRKDEDFEEGSPLSSKNWHYYSTAGLLTADEVRLVASRLANFNEENSEIAFNIETMERYLFGVGSHHAGMLPAHKAFVEGLYRSNLMKTVFATETLAAGINMPARTTVICALAKRGESSSMSLLETSNLLQMSGRAGRRGMDTEGTCVIVATPFEGQDEAAMILTDPIKPIASQFRPSYSLAVNLIVRGEGKLDVARQLVRKSFAMWEKLRMESEVAAASARMGASLAASAEEKFVNVLISSMQNQVDKRSSKFDISYMRSLLESLKDRDLLKKSSKSYIGLARNLEVEDATLSYLELELKDLSSMATDQDMELLEALFDEDQQEIFDQIEAQRQRAKSVRKELGRHPFSAIATMANKLMEDESLDGRALKNSFQITRPVAEEGRSTITADDLAKFAKSAIVVKRQLRKLATANPGLDPDALLLQAQEVTNARDDSWDCLLATTKVLVAYGCLSTGQGRLEDLDGESFEELTFKVTSAGVDVGMLGFENSLWCFVALGGTWDVLGASSKLDEFREAMNTLDDDWYDEPPGDSGIGRTPASKSLTPVSNSQLEAEQLMSHLRFLSPGELAGYVSCLISEGSRGGPSIVEQISKMTPRQQRAIQISLGCMERLTEVQRRYGVDERTCNCQLDITNCEVVTAWTNGCTWSEAVQISGAAPGDLARTLSRALDAVRQFGNLKYKPVRKSDVTNDDDGNAVIRQSVSAGFNPEIRRLCRDAAKAMNRYPLKDPLPFDVGEDEILDENEDEDEVIDETSSGADNPSFFDDKGKKDKSDLA